MKKVNLLLSVDIDRVNIDEHTRIDEHLNVKQIGFWGRLLEIITFNWFRNRTFNRVVEKIEKIFIDNVMDNTSTLNEARMQQIRDKLTRAKLYQGKNLPDSAWQTRIKRINGIISLQKN